MFFPERFAEIEGIGGNVEDFLAIGTIDWTRGHRPVRRRIHIVPPEQLGAGEARLLLAEMFPEFAPLNEMVGLLPKAVFGIVPVIPTIGDNAVRAGPFSGEVGGLGGGGHGRQHRFHMDHPVRPATGEIHHVGRVFTQMAGGEADDVNDGGSIHAVGKKIRKEE